MLIDDLVDSGNTMHEILAMLKSELPEATIKIATLCYKPHSIVKPDYFVATTEDWIVFPWEKVNSYLKLFLIRKTHRNS